MGQNAMHTRADELYDCQIDHEVSKLIMIIIMINNYFDTSWSIWLGIKYDIVTAKGASNFRSCIHDFLHCSLLRCGVFNDTTLASLPIHANQGG